MGWYCRICDKVRSNESFSGEGHKLYLQKVSEIVSNVWRPRPGPRPIYPNSAQVLFFQILASTVVRY